MNLLAVLISLLSTVPAQPAPLFTDAERSALVTYWSMPGRYSKSLPPDALTKGVWQVRLTPEGSAWLLKYQNTIGSRGIAPTVDPTSLSPNSDRAAWKAWVQARIARDRRIAQDFADAANLVIRPLASGTSIIQTPNQVPPHPTSRTGGTDTHSVRTPNTERPTPNAQNPIPPPDPGSIPATLLAAVGNPPPFAAAVTPIQYSIVFEDADSYTYVDNVLLPQAFAYYRFTQGVAVTGSPMGDTEAAAVFAAAGMTESEQRIASAVSKLEGTFEAINTYDTGYVSVGFIQFITLNDGKHSLSEVLQQEKRDRPNDFAQDFHRYGIDVTADGIIDVVDPATGAELYGPDAVHKLVDDKRLIAVFQRAGRHSTPFRVAQVQIAKSHYWPADDPILINAGTLTLSGKVSDVIHSEAGIATLFDRKVNRGTCEPISAVVARILQEHGASTLEDASQFEREIVTALKYRGDYLKDTTLSQPN